MSQEVKSILESEEKILWEGKQDLKSSMIMSVFAMTALLLFAVLFGFLGRNIRSTASNDTTSCTVNGRPAPAEECASAFIWFERGAYALTVLILVGAYINYRVTYYAITNKRILIKSGWIGADMRSVYYDQIRSAFVDVGIIGKIFGTGSILFDTGRTTQSSHHSRRGGYSTSTETDYDRFHAINKPYEVYKIVQENLTSNKEALYSGRGDYESNREEYKKFIEDTEKIKKEV